ncbi:hypothetical protein SAMN05216469_11147 [Ruminococcus albus]|uniref:Uncharacterized protein n=2 Tax=Ruminococcus albus TaxID=1264 RepID=A0A1H7MCC7_RUMAL|nr:hypothetical protein SAMN05216469_11147 [Ruminococcus albus]
MKKCLPLNKESSVILVSVIVITILEIAILWIRYSDSPYITDYKGEFVNSAGDKYKVEIIKSRDDPDHSHLDIRKDEFRYVSLYHLNYNKPKEALPQDIRFIDMSKNSYIAWIYQKDGSEMIIYPNVPYVLFYLDSEITDLNALDMCAINEIEQSNALDSLPDADIHKAKWENYFSRLKQEYEESTDTSSKEDSV